ncbi:hypothetical protein [Parachryseolinea silvisoli]|uniref:hypothetical protein n=1 Tax=Parachryseolinea silvisoli TaxID=2873601 RepID=UPI00226589DE|nr:hypothetical protein [Parachryseolinea silvisoli]MCD9017276.1 hypothetical protein [Parachryseolinea silvisoli]
MKKVLLTLVGLTLCSTLALAQWGDEEMDQDASWRDRVFTGGGFGLSFSNYYDYVSVSPLIGYRLTPKLAAGIQVQYRYTKYKQYSFKFSTNDYGVSPFVRYSVAGPFFLHAEYEYLNYEFPLSANESVRRSYNSFLAGGGFFQPLGRFAGFYLMALYNFSYTDPDPGEFSPYDSPLVLRAGVTAGF